MLVIDQIDQTGLRVDVRDVLRTAMFREWDEGTVVNLPRLVPTFANFPEDGSLNQIQSA